MKGTSKIQMEEAVRILDLFKVSSVQYTYMATMTKHPFQTSLTIRYNICSKPFFLRISDFAG